MAIRPRSIGETATRVPLFPLSSALLLPHTRQPLNVFEPRYIALVDHVLATDRIIGLIQPRNETTQSPPGNDAPLKQVGCLGYLRAFEEYDDGRYGIILEGISRFRIKRELETAFPFRMAEIDLSNYEADFDPDAGVDQVNRQEFLDSMRAYAEFANIEFDWDGIKKIETPLLINMCCVMAPYGPPEKQALLEAESLNHRAQTLMALAELERASASSTGSPLQ